MALRPTAGMGFIRAERGAVLMVAPGADDALDPETIIWRDGIRSAGGSVSDRSIEIANDWIIELHAQSYNLKIKYALPLLGNDLTAARMPLRDKLGVGMAGNTAFVNADFTQATGLQGNGTTKYLSSGIFPSQLGLANNGGLGWWENNISFGASVQPMGCYGVLAVGADERFVLDLRATLQDFSWGNTANRATLGSPASNGHYYGQRSSSTLRVLYKSGVQIASAITSDAAPEADDHTILLVGADQDTAGIAPWPGRCAFCYMTDGTMNAAEIASFHALLQTKLLTPTGRPG